MFGPSMMVAPMVDGESKRSVYFPAGDWYDFFTGEKIIGGQRVDITKSLEELPLYVKCDSIVPIAEPVNHVGKDTRFKIHARVYGDHPEEFWLFEDDGETYDFEQGAQTTAVLSWDGAKGAVKRTGGFTKSRYEIHDWIAVH